MIFIDGMLCLLHKWPVHFRFISWLARDSPRCVSSRNRQGKVPLGSAKVLLTGRWRFTSSGIASSLKHFMATITFYLLQLRALNDRGFRLHHGSSSDTQVLVRTECSTLWLSSPRFRYSDRYETADEIVDRCGGGHNDIGFHSRIRGREFSARA